MRARSAILLLHDVSQLVCEQMAAGRRFWSVFAVCKDHIFAKRISTRIQSPAGLSGPCIRVNANLAEIVTEAWFKVTAQLSTERLATAAHRLHLSGQLR